MIHVVVNSRAAPQGSKRHVGNGVMVESSKRVKPYREAVRYAVLESKWDGVTLEGAIRAEVRFCFRPPKSAKKSAKPTTRSTGDIDKLVRATFDALTDVGLIADDSRVVSLKTSKTYGMKDAVDIYVSEEA